MVDVIRKSFEEDGQWYFIDANGNKIGGFPDKDAADYAMDLYWKRSIGGVVKK